LIVFIEMGKVRKNYCPICGEELVNGRRGFLEVNPDETGFYLVATCKRCIFHLYQTDKIFKKRRHKKNENLINKKTSKGKGNIWIST